MKKIYVDRKDTVSGVLDKILGAEDKEIILYVPRSTKFGTSPNNFRLLKRELDAAGKKIEIESVDDSVLEMSKMIGFKSINPFFKKNQKQISDIVHPGGATNKREYPAEAKEESIMDDPQPIKKKPRTHSVPRKAIPSRHKILTVMVSALVLTGIALAVFVLPEARIKVYMKTINSDFNGSLVTGADVKAAEFANNTVKIPGLFYEKTKNITRIYQATGTQSVSTKATGTITIYNAYSSSPQNLVVGTRFQSLDGKIFRLTKTVAVPGAKTVSGKIVPSNIKATVQADAAGAEYNIPSSHFTIPGFKGSPKYVGFYGDSESAMSGGLVGMAKVATESDMDKAKDENHKTLEDGLRSEMVLNIPGEIKIIEGATKFTVTKEDVNKIADEDGNFKLTTVASLQSIGFKEADVRAVLEPRIISQAKLDLMAGDAKTGIDNSALGITLKDSSISYGSPRADFAKKNMSISLKFQSVLRRNLDVEAFREFVRGKKGSELSKSQLPFPDIQSVKINLWPFWVMSVPNNPSKVAIDVQ